MGDQPKPYVHQEYPKWKYNHATGESKIVQDAGEDKELGKDWANDPAPLETKPPTGPAVKK